MNIRRAIAVAKRVFTDLRHDKRTVGLIVLVPIGFMLAFGFVFQGDVRDVPVLVVNNDKGGGVGNASLSDRVIANLDNATLKVNYATNESEAIAAVQNGTAYAVIVFPGNLTKTVYGTVQAPSAAHANVTANKTAKPTANVTNKTTGNKVSPVPPVIPVDYGASSPEIPVYYGANSPIVFQGASPVASKTVQKSANATNQTVVPQAKVSSIRVLADKSNIDVSRAIITAVNTAVLKTGNETGQSQRLSVDTSEAVYGVNARFIDFFCPGLVCLAIWNLTTLLTLEAFVGERVSGTLPRLLASPLRESEIVAGYSIAYGTLGILQSGLLLGVGVLLFNIAIVGNVILAFVMIALLALVSQALGILLSSVARGEREAGQFAPFLILAAVLLSGIIWPLEAIPEWLRPASYLLPTTYAVEALRSVMMRGWGFSMIWIDIVALLLFASAFLVLAVVMLKKRK
ncbi:MAG: ABC transporter permease [Halobacteriota archaeon]